uniref:predicted GPI-anchored protein 58 n=1 Tax=Odobenus rosmarus divergens TaxID=9708 RepID=UPI00063C88CA|nr:PREDICTED: predicted GPI-anchored protein 58 [Odobenus rosmarus divergens]
MAVIDNASRALETGRAALAQPRGEGSESSGAPSACANPAALRGLEAPVRTSAPKPTASRPRPAAPQPTRNLPQPPRLPALCPHLTRRSSFALPTHPRPLAHVDFPSGEVQPRAPSVAAAGLEEALATQLGDTGDTGPPDALGSSAPGAARRPPPRGAVLPAPEATATRKQPSPPRPA